MSEPLRVCVDARVEPGAAGGVAQAVLGLALGLSRLEDGDEEVGFLVRPGRGEWLRPYAGGRVELLEAVRPEPPPRPRLGERLRARLRPSERVVPESKGAAEAWGAEVVHLPIQSGFRTPLPTLYHPWDLQHLHFPEFFDPDDLREREAVYRTLCRQARVVVAATEWGRRDLVERLGVPARKIAVVPLAPLLDAYPDPSEEDLARVTWRHELPERFALYPAQTWPHKNHLALLEALALLARAGVRVPLVCSGWTNDHRAAIERRVRELGLERQVQLVGHVPELELRALYRLARVLVFPSLHEGFGFPVLEAFAEGLPVVCSDLPPLREVTAGAALTFDPRRPEELAERLRSVWEDDALRAELRARGRARAAGYSWERAARTFRAHYRRLAGRALGEEDRRLVRESHASLPNSELEST